MFKRHGAKPEATLVILSHSVLVRPPKTFCARLIARFFRHKNSFHGRGLMPVT